ncbi:hypothetical protein FRC19_010119 [Serendipita sp. 401]|nr:hypothetical protein FRC19_010119 [Serendipita sp. 401]KAG8838120.1 hypothetical protein FRC18_006153 [Serendipita sp. 400]KAG9056719.1 hypothetical protein FS842_009811 [Serendipita sp. 407]
MSTKGLEIGFFGLHIFSLATQTLLTATLLFGFRQPGSTRPNPLLPANTSFYIGFSLVACILLFTNHLHGPSPPAALCHAQSALMLAFPPALSCLALSLVLTVWRLAWQVHHDQTPCFSDTQFNAMLIAFPYLIFVAFVLAGSVVGANSIVTRQNFYCMTNNTIITTLSSVASLLLLLSTSVFQIWTIYIVYKRYRISRKFGRAETGSDISVFLRVLAFGIFVLVALILSCIALVNYTLPIADILVATFGPMIFLIFASQDEVLRCWHIKQRDPLQDRSDSVATLNSARTRQGRTGPRDSSTFSFMSSPVGASDLQSYRFPPEPTGDPTKPIAA